MVNLGWLPKTQKNNMFSLRMIQTFDTVYKGLALGSTLYLTKIGIRFLKRALRSTVRSISGTKSTLQANKGQCDVIMDIRKILVRLLDTKGARILNIIIQHPLKIPIL